MQKVFNIGFSKTGTTSFEHAVEHLGYKTYHGHFKHKHNDYMLLLWIHRDYDEIRKMSNYWEAFADAPWGGTDLYKKLFEWYPEAKFVHTLRKPEDWYNSLEKMLLRFDPDPETALETYHATDRYGFSYFMKSNYGISKLAGAKPKILEFYNRHNDEVAEFMTRNNASYLRFDSIAGEGWEKLCPFLGHPVPEIPYPHRNDFSGVKNSAAVRKPQQQQQGFKEKVGSGIKRLFGK